MSNSSGRIRSNSRQQAAERLTDIAYPLITGGPLKLDDDQQVSAPVADQVMSGQRASRRAITWSSG